MIQMCLIHIKEQTLLIISVHIVLMSVDSLSIVLDLWEHFNLDPNEVHLTKNDKKLNKYIIKTSS